MNSIGHRRMASILDVINERLKGTTAEQIELLVETAKWCIVKGESYKK